MNESVVAVDLGFRIPLILKVRAPPTKDELAKPPLTCKVSEDGNEHVIEDGNPVALPQDAALVAVFPIKISLGNTICMILFCNITLSVELVMVNL